jgi:hypothetical protein
MALPQYVILAVRSKIDAKRGDHFIQADFSLLFLLEPSEIRKINKTDIFS